MEAILEEIVKSVLDFCSDQVDGRGGKSMVSTQRGELDQLTFVYFSAP